LRKFLWFIFSEEIQWLLHSILKENISDVPVGLAVSKSEVRGQKYR
jgi:hypothetical protein